ncbi:MAG: hypothetical protein MK006_14345 [Pirellulales bacterium]|nr:hypothetical protein [Pirellulales bacterium]
MKRLLRDSSNYDESHNPSLPDKNKPWCLNCRLHTDYHSVYERRGKHVNKKLCCDVCGGDTYWPVNPNKFKFVGIAVILFVFLVGAALATNGFGIASEPASEEEFFTGLFCIPLGLYGAYMVNSSMKGVTKKWEEFHKWAKEHRTS